MMGDCSIALCDRRLPPYKRSCQAATAAGTLNIGWTKRTGDGREHHVCYGQLPCGRVGSSIGLYGVSDLN